MDPETRAFLEANFKTLDEKLTSHDEKFTAIDRRFDSIDEKLTSHDEKFEEVKRYSGVVAEGLRNEIRQIAEGHAFLAQKGDLLQERLDAEFAEIKSMIRFSHAELERQVLAMKNRIDQLETHYADLASRLHRLENKL